MTQRTKTYDSWLLSLEHESTRVTGLYWITLHSTWRTRPKCREIAMVFLWDLRRYHDAKMSTFNAPANNRLGKWDMYHLGAGVFMVSVFFSVACLHQKSFPVSYLWWVLVCWTHLDVSPQEVSYWCGRRWSSCVKAPFQRDVRMVRMGHGTPGKSSRIGAVRSSFRRL